MIIEKINYFILKVRLRRNINFKKKHTYRPKTKVDTIGIILDDKLQIDDKIFELFISELEVTHANLKFLIFEDFPNDQKQKTESKFDKLYVSKKDISHFGNLNEKFKPFLTVHYDLMINYFDEPNTYLEYISSKYRRCLSLGFSGADKNLNDLIFDFDAKDTASFISESKKYLISIFKK